MTARTERPTKQSVMIVRVGDESKLPERKTAGSAGYDCFCREQVEIPPGETGVVPLGFHIRIPDGHVGLLVSRSGLASVGIVLANSPGIIDSDYTGEVCAIIANRGRSKFISRINDRVCQLVVVPYIGPDLREVGSLPATERGNGGFGSTGR